MSPSAKARLLSAVSPLIPRLHDRPNIEQTSSRPDMCALQTCQSADSDSRDFFAVADKRGSCFATKFANAD